MLDVVFLAATAVLFALVALVARGVERLGPQPRATRAASAESSAR